MSYYAELMETLGRHAVFVIICGACGLLLQMLAGEGSLFLQLLSVLMVLITSALTVRCVVQAVTIMMRPDEPIQSVPITQLPPYLADGQEFEKLLFDFWTADSEVKGVK